MLLVIICGNSLTSDHRVIDRFKKPIGIFFFYSSFDISYSFRQ